MQLKEKNDKIEKRNYHLHNDDDFKDNDIHSNDNYHDEINRFKINSNSSEGMKNENKKMKKQRKSHLLSAVRGTENSMRRSVSTTPQYVHAEGTMDPYSVCDRRARSFSAPRGRVLGGGERDQERVGDGDRDGDRGRYVNDTRMRVKKGEREGREEEVEWKGERDGQERSGRQPYAYTVHRIRSSSVGATGRSTGLAHKPSTRVSDPGLFFGSGLGSGSSHRGVMGTGTGGKGFISSFTRGGMKNRVGHYNHRQQQQLQQQEHHYHYLDKNIKHNGRKHNKEEKRNIPFYNNVEFKVLSPMDRPSKTQQNKNTSLIDNKEVSEQPFNESDTSYNSPTLLNRKRASELARIR